MGNLLIIKNADFSEVAIENITPPGLIRVNVVTSPEGGGFVSGGGSYYPGESVQIAAVANDGYEFIQWSDGNTNAVRTVIVGNSDITYTAQFRSVSTTTLLLPAETLNNLPQTSYNGIGNWISGALAKAYFANNKKLHISHIYVRPSTNISSLSLKVWNVVDENTAPTDSGNKISVEVNESMIDLSKGVNGLYKVPVNIDCIGILISIGTNNIYFNATSSVPSEQAPNAGWWAMVTRKSWNSRDTKDDLHPIAIGYVISYL